MVVYVVYILKHVDYSVLPPRDATA